MSNIKFVIQASTPDECRQAIVKWLYDHSTAISSQARIVERKRAKHDLSVKAEAIKAAAKFISEVEIKKPNFAQDITNFPELKNNPNYTIDDWLKVGMFITAIKKRRVDTGEELKEAKDYCDKRRVELGLTK